MLSLCLITKNEEHNIAGCLESAREIADEIVLVDTGSVDATIEIAAGYGTRIFEVPWRENFAAAKNETLRHATGDWILALDADERLTATGRGKIHRLLEHPEHDAYLLQLRSPYKLTDTFRRTSTGLAVRLFRNNIGLRYRGRIHERVGPSTTRKEVTLATTNITIEHLGYRDNLGPKYRRNLAVALRRKTKHDAFSRYDMARMQAGLGRYAEAERHLRRGLEFTGVSAWLRAQILVLLGDVLAYMNRDESGGLAPWHEAAETEPEMVAPRLRLGICYYHRGEYGKAARHFERIVELLHLGGLRGVPIDDECTLSEAWASLSACYVSSGRREEALTAAIASRNTPPEDETVKVIPWEYGFGRLAEK